MSSSLGRNFMPKSGKALDPGTKLIKGAEIDLVGKQNKLGGKFQQKRSPEGRGESRNQVFVVMG